MDRKDTRSKGLDTGVQVVDAERFHWTGYGGQDVFQSVDARSRTFQEDTIFEAVAGTYRIQILGRTFSRD